MAENADTIRNLKKYRVRNSKRDHYVINKLYNNK